MAYGSRVLNDNGSVLGLNIYDLIGSVTVLVITSELLKPFGLEFLSVLVAIFSLILLIPIRLRYRRKIIRDAVRFYIGRFYISSFYLGTRKIESSHYRERHALNG